MQLFAKIDPVTIPIPILFLVSSSSSSSRLLTILPCTLTSYNSIDENYSVYILKDFLVIYLKLKFLIPSIISLVTTGYGYSTKPYLFLELYVWSIIKSKCSLVVLCFIQASKLIFILIFINKKV